MDSTNAQSVLQYIKSSTNTQSVLMSGYAVMENEDGYITFEAKAQSGIHPELYFKYVKKKLGVLEKMKLDSRLKRLEKAFLVAVENGQDALGEKILKELCRETKESLMYAKGIKHFIELDDLNKYKRNIRGGHISDTRFENFTRAIPESVLSKKKKVDGVFDGYVIYHYWDEEAEKKREKKQKISPEEKARMRDPILFGVIKESNKLYFIADWEDEYCDLTFEELVDYIGKEEDEITISRNPKLNL